MKSLRKLSLLGLSLAVLCGTSILMAGKGGNGGGKPGGGEDPPPEPTPIAPFSYELRTFRLSDPANPSVVLGSQARSVNKHGDVVGTSGGSLFDNENVNRNLNAYVYHSDTDTIVALNSHLTDPKWWIHNVNRINDQGQITGYGYYDSDGDGNLIEEPNLVGYSVLLTPTGDGDYVVSQWGNLYGPGDLNNSGDILDGHEGRILLYRGMSIDDLGSSDEYGGSSALTDRDQNGHVIVVGSNWKFDTATDIAPVVLPPLYSKGKNPGFCVANDVSNSGIIAGETSVSRNDSFAAVYLPTGWYSLGSITDSNEWNDSSATSISNNSLYVVGFSLSGDVNDSPNHLGFLHDMEQDAMFSLNAMMANPADQFDERPDVVDVNNAGMVCGTHAGQAFILIPLLP